MNFFHTLNYLKLFNKIIIFILILIILNIYSGILNCDEN